MPWFFLFFVASGFSGLVYQVVWLRLTMAGFGVTTPMISIVLSVFMGGLALGSFWGGRLARRLSGRSPELPLRIFGLAELLIGALALLVPALLGLGRSLITHAGSEWGSTIHYLVSGALVTLALLPSCALMGATFPLAMGAIRGRFPAASQQSFSFLYVANVLGAMSGTLAAAFVLIELLGFRRTQYTAMALNGLVGVLALALAARWTGRAAALEVSTLDATSSRAPTAPLRLEMGLVFLSGFTGLALEVIWVRLFNPFLGPVVYAFATMLTVYLAATTAGTLLYRSRLLGGRLKLPWPVLAVLAGISVSGAIFACDPRLLAWRGLMAGALRLAVGIGPLCLLLGYLTPMLLDRISRGEPARAGAAYALNTLGCILGPLVAGFGLLPLIGEKASMLLLGLPFLLAGFAAIRLPAERTAAARWTRMGLVPVALVLVALVLYGSTRAKDYPRRNPDAIVRRDSTATVVATVTGSGRRLLVNGWGMTHLTPITKAMAHLPLAHLDHAPRHGLVLCLGMGTSFRSVLSWGIDCTAVELVPSIPGLLGFFHADGNAILESPRARVVVDDARRFLERTREKYDVIVIDPPPPVEAAGSSLLYSKEFLAVVRDRLGNGGILQHWLPEGDATIVASVARALQESFPHVRVFKSLKGWGWHFLAREIGIPVIDSETLAARMPESAAGDFIEWGPHPSAAGMFREMLDREQPLEVLLSLSPIPALTDDRPWNEYYILRRSGSATPTLR